MKLVLVNQRYGHSRTIVIKGWLKGLLSLCLLGAPVALGLGYQLAVTNENSRLVVSQERGALDVSDPADVAGVLEWTDSASVDAAHDYSVDIADSGDSADSAAQTPDFTESLRSDQAWSGAWHGAWYTPWQLDLLTEKLMAVVGYSSADIMRSLTMPEWIDDVAAEPIVVAPSHTLVLVAQIDHAASSQSHHSFFAHGRVIDPASYIHRTHR